MHKLTFALGAAAAASIMAAPPSGPAHALVLPAPAGLSADARNIEPARNVHYVCRYGYYGRVCSWRPQPYYSYGYAPYYAYGYYRPYRPWRHGHHHHHHHHWR
jgi:hypothetical protein